MMMMMMVMMVIPEGLMQTSAALSSFYDNVASLLGLMLAVRRRCETGGWAELIMLIMLITQSE